MAVALTVALAFVVGRQSAQPAGSEGSTAPQAAAPERIALAPFVAVQQQSRGITAPGAPPIVAVAEPVPTAPPPSAAPAPTIAPAAAAPATSGTATGAGTGAAVGTGTGTGAGEGAGTGASPLPLPGLVPLVLSPVPSGYYRIGVRISDAGTRAPLADVCVIMGTWTCGPDKPRTNEAGVWWVDVPRESASQWTIKLKRPGYQDVTRRFVTSGEDVWLQLGLRRAR